MEQIKIVLPDKTSPGFLRRSKQALEFREKLRSPTPEPAVIDAMIEFMLPFIQEPEDRQVARELLWEASQEQFEKIMSALSGGSEATVPPPNSTT